MELPVAIGTIIADHFRVDRPLGAGSMGVVAAGWNLQLDQPVAIKFPAPGAFGSEEGLARFRREVRAAARIRSEHVVRVMDVGIFEGRLPYMVMELLDGRSLEEELAERGQLPLDEAVGYVLEAIEVLAEAHAAGLVHRDLKPANLFLARRADRSRFVKVLDFGVAKSMAQDAKELRLTRTGVIVGSPLYMAPEQLRANQPIDGRTDIWALGAILFQLVTGATPYDASSVGDLYATILRDPPARPSIHRADLPLAFEEVVGRCLAAEPANRYPDVSSLADALLPFAPPSAVTSADRAHAVLFGTLDSRRSSVSSLAPLTRGRALSTSAGVAGSWRAPAQVENRSRGWLVVALLVLALGAGATYGLTSSRRPSQAPAPSPRATPAAARALPASPGALVVPPPLPVSAAPAPVVTVVPSVSATAIQSPRAAPLPAPKARPPATDNLAGTEVFGGRK